MCFSATASFSAAAVLGTMGTYAVYGVLKRNLYRALPLALTPLLFALQQASEGVIWLLLQQGQPAWVPLFTAIFITYAYIVWPIWMGFALALVEPCGVRQRILYSITAVGVWLACMYSYYLLHYGVTVADVGHHICYTSPYFNAHAWTWGIPYVLAVAGPFFISSIRIFAVLGLILLASCAVTILFWKVVFTSVWCFFAAILSALLLVVLHSKAFQDAVAHRR